MKRFIKITALLSMALLVVGLSSCTSEYNFYKDWSEAGASISEDHIYTTISLEEAEAKIENNEKFALVVATSQSVSARNTIVVIQNQAEYLSYEGTIYFVDATNYIETSALRQQLRSALRLKTNYSASTQQAIVACYENGTKYLDTSNLDEGAKNGTCYLSGPATVNFERLSYFMFTEFLVD